MDGELVRRAEAAGISVSYENWRHQRVEVSAETIEALLAALDASGVSASPASASPASGAGARLGLASADPASGAGPAPAVSVVGEAGGGGQLGAATGSAGNGVRARLPERRAWGFTVQLYSVRSRDSWGHGDLHDLAELARWSGRELGAGFILVNPLHAAEPLPPVSPSPYLPMTRRYTSPLYLRVEDIPEYAGLPPAARQEVERLAAPLRALATSPELIDRDAVWSAKRAALERLFELPLSTDRRASFDAYRKSEGAELRYWTSWCALAERHGADWRHWPARLKDREAGVAEAAARHGGSVRFHAWLQWLVDSQLAAAQRAALAAGMAHGVIHDLAVGVHPGGADAWAHQDLLVAGVSVGAPPDNFNQLGQDWAQPPWNPRRLAQAGYRPLAELFGAAFRHAGGLRVDHVMGLTRLWWVPEGMTADRGAYVGYDHRAAVAALAGEAARSGGLAIGEDLGTVPGWLRGYLAGHDILGTVMLWFAQEPDGSPLPAPRWRRDCMATVGTHDVPTVAGFCTGAQVTERERLGLLTEPPDIERARAARLVAGWRDLLGATGLLSPGESATPAELTVGLYGFLARTPAALVGVSLADAVGDTRSQNIPGTSTEYPNWRVPLCDQAGHPVLLEDLPGHPLVTAVARAANPR
jgi:4-alpha-glucanotransferase